MTNKKKLARQFFSVLKKHGKDIFDNLEDFITDLRDNNRIRYSVKDIIITTLLMFVTNTESRKAMNKKFEEPKIIESVNAFNDSKLTRLPHSDTKENFYKTVDIEELKTLLYMMNAQIIRNKKFKKNDLLLNEYYMICIDMTRTQKFYEQVNEELLWEDKKGKRYFYNAVCEAKFVFRNNMCLPVLSEFLKNSDAVDGKFIKQDCELKAAYRLIDNLKKMFPRLKICLLFDGLYPNETIFNLCKEHGFKYIMTFPEDKIPSLFEQYSEFKKLDNLEIKKKRIDVDKYQRVYFHNGFDYRDIEINIVEVKEYSAKKQGLCYKNIFLTNIEITESNVFKIVEGGRFRWKIEHSFNREKNIEFSLEHAYSHNANSIKAYHILMQISDWILSFMLFYYNENGKSSVFRDFNSLSDFFKYIFVDLVREAVSADDMNSLKYAILIEPKTA